MLRRYTFKLYPNAAQEAAMREQARLCAVLWNALLEMREDYYRRAKQQGLKKTSLSAFDQGKDLTAMNADPDCAEFKALGRGTQERVADMLDLAMKAFFKRAKAGAGASSGYPRYKSTRHAENIPLREPVKSGWKFEPKGANGECLSGDFSAKKKREHLRKSGASVGSGAEPLQMRGDDRVADFLDGVRVGAEPLQMRGDDRKICVRENNNWRLTLRGVPGAIKARGKFPADPEALKTADVKFYDGAWWFSVCVDVPARMVAGKEKLTVELDLIDSFASVKSASGRCAPGLSDPFYSGRKGEFPNISRAVGDSPCGDPSNEGEAQGIRSGQSATSTCGDPANAGEAQGDSPPSLRTITCGEPANEGKAQVENPPSQRPPACGEPSNEGGAQAMNSFTQADAACGEPSNIGEAQGHGVDAIQSERDRRYKRGSIRWRREKQRIARIKAKQARRTKETLHKWTTAIVREAAELAIIAPPVKDMTKTGRGNERAHGAEVKTVAALNRHVLSMAPASAVQMLEYKAAEAGIACAVERRQDHQIRIGGDLREAAVTAKKARRAVKREAKKLLQAAE